MRLSYRSFPSYRPILQDYQTVLTALSQGKTEKVSDQLVSLEQNRQLMRAKAERARDFLDWFEITRARQASGVFEDYLRLKDRLEFKAYRREDDLTNYLDRMDQIFSRAQDQPKSAAPSLLLPP